MKIIVLTLEGEKVGVTPSDGVTPQRAIEVCSAAIKFFQGQLIEAEVQRRMLEKEEDASTADPGLPAAQVVRREAHAARKTL